MSFLQMVSIFNCLVTGVLVLAAVIHVLIEGGVLEFNVEIEDKKRSKTKKIDLSVKICAALGFVFLINLIAAVV